MIYSLIEYVDYNWKLIYYNVAPISNNNFDESELDVQMNYE
jgi:hypothetical protein